MADFVDIPIDVTAKQIEDKVKETIDDTVRRGSTNPVMSGAVANAFELFKADTDHIKDGAVKANKLGQYAVTAEAIAFDAVETEKIKNGAVTSEKLADGAVDSDNLAGASVDYYHLKYGAVHPEALDRAYARLNTINTVVDDSSFHNLLIQNADELSDPFKKVVLFLVWPISEGMTANIKEGRCFGFFVSKQEFWFTNINYNITYRVMFDESSLVSVESININLAVLEPENGGDDGGEQFKKYIDDNYIGYFPTGGASHPYVFYNFYTPYPYKNEQLKIVLNSSDSLISFYRRECHLDTDGQIEWTNWQDLMTRTKVDQTYNPESENAQSGYAVAEAVSNLPYVDIALGYYPLSSDEINAEEIDNYSTYVYKASSALPCRFSLAGLKSVLVGDIDTALDNIIAIQNSYIGGATE